MISEQAIKGSERGNKILLILDIDETLIHATDKILSRQPDFTVFKYHVYKRPFLDEFLREMKEYFLLAVWSSASEDYVSAIVDQVFPKEWVLEFVWGSSRCTMKRNLWDDPEAWKENNRWQEYYSTKPLKKVRRRGYQLDRILIVDDSPHKSRQNYGNAIHPAAFEGNPNDDELKHLAEYLKLLKDKPTIRNIEKRNWRKQVDGSWEG